MNAKLTVNFPSNATETPRGAGWRGVSLLVAACAFGCGESPGSLDSGAPADASGMDAHTSTDARVDDDAGARGCDALEGCDDGIDCTEDTCTPTGSCRHAVVPALCPAGSSCHPARGCEMGRACTTDMDCRDEDACTVSERCDPSARTCVFDPLDGDGDGDPPRVCGGGDCDDNDAAVYPTGPERCNGADDDCDGVVDEACGETAWERVLGNGAVEDLAVDDDSVYIVGSFTGTLDFGSDVFVSPVGRDGFIAALNRDGTTVQWSRQIGADMGDDNVGAIALDADGNVLVAGTAGASADFGAGPTDGPRFFVASYTPDGDHRWSRRIANATPRAIAVGSDGNLYLTGYHTRTVDLGGGDIPWRGYQDVFVLSLTSTGEHRWSRGFGAESFDEPGALAIDSSNNVNVTGHFRLAVDFGGGALASQRNSQDGFVLSLDSNGAHRWSMRFGGDDPDGGTGITVNRAGDVQVAGSAWGQDFGDGPITENGFLASFAADGAYRWSIELPVGPRLESGPQAIADDGAGNTIVVGDFYDTIDLGGGVLASVGGSDIFCAVFDARGAHRFSARFGGASYDSASAVADGRHSFFIGGLMGGAYVREVVP